MQLRTGEDRICSVHWSLTLPGIGLLPWKSWHCGSYDSAASALEQPLSHKTELCWKEGLFFFISCPALPGFSIYRGSWGGEQVHPSYCHLLYIDLPCNRAMENGAEVATSKSTQNSLSIPGVWEMRIITWQQRLLK